MNKKKQGNYYKYKTKKFFENLGYTVEYAEVYSFYRKNGKTYYSSKDILYSDLIAYNKEHILLIQVKYNKKHIAEAKKNYQALNIPCVYKLIIVWVANENVPEILLIK